MGLSEKANRGAPLVEVQETISSKPTVNIRRSVEKLVLKVPPMYLVGLSRIVLRDKGALNRRERRWRRARRKKGKVILGCYYRATANREARIEIFVDEICNKWPMILLRIPTLRDVFVGSVLFHEIGHHIHRHVLHGHGDPEAAAKDWGRTLLRQAMRRHTWYFLPIVRGTHWLLSRFVRPNRR